MKIFKTFGLTAGLIVLGFGTLNVFGQDTIEQAIAKVNSINHPNPIRQNQLRAQMAMNIIMARIRTVNPNGIVPPEFEALDNDLEVLRESKGLVPDQVINWSWKNRAGRCDEQVNLMKKILEASGVKVTVAVSNMNHTFILINLAPDAALDIPWTWGPDAIAPDPWLRATLKAEEAWNERRYFDEGRGNVTGLSEAYSTRQYLERFGNAIRRNPNAIDINCQVKLQSGTLIIANYRTLLKNYFKIPEPYRKNLDFRPREDLILEAAKLEFESIRGPITRLARNDSIGITNLHAALSDLDGRLVGIDRCCDEVKNFRRMIAESFRLLAKLKTDATLGVSDTGPDDVPDDIVKNTGKGTLNWAGTWVRPDGVETVNISGGGNSFTASFRYKGSGYSGSGQWTNCRVNGTTATCSWTGSHDDATKSGTRKGTVEMTLSGNTMAGRYNEGEAPVWSWKAGYGPHNVSSSMIKGAVFSVNYKRQ